MVGRKKTTIAKLNKIQPINNLNYFANKERMQIELAYLQGCLDTMQGKRREASEYFSRTYDGKY